jgi:NarL family two-component system response regulator LiaR
LPHAVEAEAMYLLLRKTPMKINVLLVDDQEMVRRGLRMSLALEADLHVVGEAGDGQTAVEIARKLLPDVIVMDVVMPGLDGISATRLLRKEDPDIQVVTLSLHDDAETRNRAIQAGAFAFVPKNAPTEELLASIREAVKMRRDGTAHP